MCAAAESAFHAPLHDPSAGNGAGTATNVFQAAAGNSEQPPKLLAVTVQSLLPQIRQLRITLCPALNGPELSPALPPSNWHMTLGDCVLSLHSLYQC